MKVDNTGGANILNILGFNMGTAYTYENMESRGKGAGESLYYICKDLGDGLGKGGGGKEVFGSGCFERDGWVHFFSL